MTVYLVGAGPGDPGLLTVRGAELMARADVVVFDRLAGSALLDLAPPRAERIDVGKQPGGPSIPQGDINDLLVELGGSHGTVVRLKGGDPFVFARGGEEARALADAGVRFEIVPGITSAIAAPAYAGIPVTLRYSSTSFTVVTGHEDPAKGYTSVNWDAIVDTGGTIVVLMGVRRISAIVERLLAAGMAPDTPAAAVSWGTRAAQSTVRTTVSGLPTESLEAPSAIVIGGVAAQELTWFEQRPLFGRRVVVTRTRTQASALSAQLRELGAETIEIPTIAIAEPADGGAGLRASLERLDEFEWVIVTSPNGARRFVDALGDARRLAGVKLAAIGPATADVLASSSLLADLVPDRYVAEALVEAMGAPTGDRRRVLIARAAVARDVLPDGLAAAGWDVEVVEAYRTIRPEPTGRHREALADADTITFTSSSTVTNFVDMFGAEAVPPTVACIGPITAATARDLGLTVAVEAPVHTVDGLVDALVVALEPRVADGDR